MRMFAPNALVVGDEVFTIDAANGTPNSPAAAEAYEQAIMEMRTQILGTPFGKQWLEITGNNKEPIVIVPTNETGEAVAQTFPNITSHPDRLADSLASGVQGRGTGRGTPIRLKFNPQAHVGGLCGPSGAALLVHEFTHGYRSAEGRFNPRPMASMVRPERKARDSQLVQRFPNWEEWFAVVVENVFRAELGHSIIRTNWDIAVPAFATSPHYFQFWNISTVGVMNDSQDFADAYAPAVQVLRHEEPALFRAMLHSTAWFNPARDLP